MIHRLASAALLTVISLALLYWIWRRKTALSMLRSLSKFDECQPSNSVSVIIPARNNESVISSCIESILVQSGVDFEVIVVDDSSSDSTLRLAKSYESSNRVRVIEVDGTPRGWVGKNWACYLGYLNSREDLLVFMDSDTLLTKSDALRKALCILEKKGADVLSLYPRFRMKLLWEKIWIPFAANFIYLLAHPTIINSQNNPRSFLMGAFTVFRRRVYEEIRGHRSIRGVLAEDKALGERVKAQGHRFLLAYGGDLVMSRWGGGLAESWNSLKRVIPFSIRSRREILAASLIITLLFLLPPAILVAATLLHDVMLALFSASPMLLTMVLEASELLRNRENSIYALAYPAAAVFIVLNLTYILLRSGDVEVVWRGRKYRVKAFS